MTHARLAPSAAHRWSKCAGSPGMEARYPEEESTAAREGTAAHWWATEALHGRDATDAPNGETITDEMREAGAMFVDTVSRACKTLGPRSTARIEQHVTMHGLISPDCDGTPDWYGADPDRRIVHVVDYKFGHRFVDAFANLQMLCYLAGVFEAYELTAEDVADWSCSLTIVQPRNYSKLGPVRTWTITGAVAWRYITELADAAERASEPDARLTTGEHCRDCKARHACPALQAVGMLAVDLSRGASPVEMPPGALGIEIRMLTDAQARLTARLDGLQAVALDAIRRGGNVPGWGVEHGQGRERWTAPAAEVFALGQLYGADLRKPPEAITPAQARKAGVDALVIDAYAERPRGAAQLVAVNNDTFAKVFG